MLTCVSSNHAYYLYYFPRDNFEGVKYLHRAELEIFEPLQINAMLVMGFQANSNALWRQDCLLRFRRHEQVKFVLALVCLQVWKQVFL